MNAYSVKCIVGPYWTGEAITQDVHYFEADTRAEAEAIAAELKSAPLTRTYVYKVAA